MNDSEQNRIFVLDTNILIEMNRWIPLGLCPEFWQLLGQALHDKKWVLLDIVVKEVGFPQTLVDWCKKQKDAGLVTEIEDSHRQRGVEINGLYKMIDEASGKSESDTYLIAYAEISGMVVLSREGPKKPAETLFKVPDVCGKLNIPCSREPGEFYRKIGFTSAIYR